MVVMATTPSAHLSTSNSSFRARGRSASSTPGTVFLSAASRRRRSSNAKIDVVVASSSREEESSSSSSSSSSSRRETIVNLAFLGISLPLWKDIFHDLGFYSGPDDLFAKVPEASDFDERYAGENAAALDTAVFAGGCFWCMEETFEEPEKLGKVLATTSGYAGGTVANPKYLQVCKGDTGHKEVVRVLYDKNKISYKELLFLYFRQIDPTREDGMFLDGGEQYASAIFVNSDEQKKEALEAIERMEKLNVFRSEENAKESKTIKTKVVDLRDLPKEGQFFPAEIYHQDYFEKNKGRYSVYRFMSGRDPYSQNRWQNSFDKSIGGKEKAFEAIFN